MDRSGSLVDSMTPSRTRHYLYEGEQVSGCILDPDQWLNLFQYPAPVAKTGLLLSADPVLLVPCKIFTRTSHLKS